ncbi:hypothetical protein [Vibrio atlanticus]|uniref:hypothetical protein n=1 Tax=Vibrio atlanticus TaxID=693153 RepID=UPI0022AE8F3B|nr:hypothetical protein [Vibrio atlanticus]
MMTVETTSNLHSWEPELVVSLLDTLAWPVVVMIGIVILGSNLVPSIKQFFAKSQVSELSVGTTGAKATFKASQETPSESVKKVSESIELSGDYKNIVELQASNTSELSNKLKEVIGNQVAGLKISESEQVELLTTEVALLRVAIICYDINKVLFRSQYDLLSNWLDNGSSITYEQLSSYFEEQARNSDAFSDWDTEKYVSYLISSGLVESDGHSYAMTMAGMSYVAFMKRNPQHISSLSSI